VYAVCLRLLAMASTMGIMTRSRNPRARVVGGHTAAARVTASARAGSARVSHGAQTLGDYLRDQRRGAQLTLRQLADQTGVSNPYLSQIERGLRKPSADVLQQLAKGLRISAETLYVRAGILDPAESGQDSVPRAVLGDPALSERQRQVLLDIYASFRRENDASSTTSATPS
jgi:transcriptional regulator with XRE-family HTH domain